MNTKESPSASTSFSVCLPFCSASIQFSTAFFFFSFWFSLFSFFFFFSGSVFSAPFWRSLAPPFPSFKRLSFVSFLPAFLFFSVHVLPFFFSPKTFFSAQNNSLFSPKPFSVQPKTFFQPKTILSSTQNLFQFNPKHCSFVRASFSFI